MLKQIDGRKTYIGLAIGAVALIAHAAGVDIPGLKVDDSAILTNLWLIFMAAVGRSAVAKIVSPQDIAAFLKLLAASAPPQSPSPKKAIRSDKPTTR
jgi:hypothetical protein